MVFLKWKLKLFIFLHSCHIIHILIFMMLLVYSYHTTMTCVTVSSALSLPIRDRRSTPLVQNVSRVFGDTLEMDISFIIFTERPFLE